MSQPQDPSQQYPPTTPSYGQAPYGQASYPPPGQQPGQQGYQQGQAPYGAVPPAYGGYAPTSSTGSTTDDRTWATIAHVGSFVAAWIALGVLCPILTLIAKPNRPFVREHAYESLNFQLNAAALWLIFVIFGAITLGIGYFVLAIPAAAYVVFYAVCVIRAAMAANRGEMYRYPLTVRVFNP